MINDAVEETLVDALNCALDNVDDDKKHGMYVLMQNIVLDVVKGGRIQALIGRLVAHAVMQEEVLDSLGKFL